MISDEYKMPQFFDNRDLISPLGIKDTGDWSQDGQSLVIDTVSRQIFFGLTFGFQKLA